MANNPKKVKDPTEVALSAIQEALRVGETSAVDLEQVAARHAGVPPNPPAGQGENRSGAHAIDRHAPIDRQIPDPAEGSHFARRPANDDRETIGQILQTLQKSSPSRNVYTLATVFAGIWILGAGLLTISFLPSLQAALGQGSGGMLALAGLIALFFAPVLLFYFLAHMAWRGQELRMIAQSMAQMAIRFSEPEGLASDSVVTVGQAIRREVAAMGDGVERAIARAGELEALGANVHSFLSGFA